jgi:hypothetical protein
MFRIEVMGSQHISSFDITDNFSMFRRTLWAFWRQVVEGRPTIATTETLDVIRTLIAGKMALQNRKEVSLDGLGDLL